MVIIVSRKLNKASMWLALLALGIATMGGTCAVVEEGPGAGYENPGVNEERMEEQETEITDESNR